MSRLAITVAVVAVSSAAVADRDAPPSKIPLTTSSSEARQLYVKGRDFLEKLRATDARQLFEKAVALDKDFAMAWVGLANTATSTKEFFDGVQHALALVGKVSEPEKLVIRGIDAGGRGALPAQREAYEKLVVALPGDERAHMLLAGHYFGQQKWSEAIVEFEKAIAIDPKFTAPYNQLGYAYRFTEKFPEAERAFKKYIELIPGDPNPYDSYAELLMKLGRFDESIAQYKKALAIDANFAPSYIGIANDQIFQNKGNDARATLATLAARARSDGERRQARTWTALSYLHEGAWGKAFAEIDQLIASSTGANDLGQKANDLNFRGNALLEAGRTKEAASSFDEQVAASAKANYHDDVKAQIRRNHMFDEGRVALANKDLAGAKKIAAAYAKAVAGPAIPFELFQSHELDGRIAIAAADWKAAVAALAQANPQDPRVMYLTAVALEGAGDKKAAAAMAKRAGDFHAFAPNYAYVRTKARALAEKLK